MRALLLLLLLAACDDRKNLVPPDWDLNRMIHQPRYDMWEASDFFPDGRTMQAPPEGTIHRDQVLAPALARGERGGAPVEALPVPVTLELLQLGRRNYEIFCAACHGIDGWADTMVAANMPLVKPPSLHDPALRQRPPGHFFQVISEGYGMMPRYAYQLDVRERWAVVAYVQALQRSSVRLDALSPELRRQALEELGP